jgi:hypothetical protein
MQVLYGTHSTSQLDSVQRRAARFVSNNFQDREPGAVTSIIMLFQVMMVRGKKEKRYTSARLYIVLKATIPLVLLSAGKSRCSAARVYYPSRAVPGVNSAPPCF